MKRILFLFLLPLFAFTLDCKADDFNIVESEEVRLEGDKMVLDGPVVLENEMGKIFAKRATLSVTNRKGKFQFHHAVLEEEVFIAMEGKGEIHCQRAEFDKEKGTADFFAGEGSQDFITASFAGAELRSKKATMMLHEGPQGKAIDRIEAEGEVTIRMRNQLNAQCERARYEGTTLFLLQNVYLDFGAYGCMTISDEVQVTRDAEGGLGIVKCMGKSNYLSENDEKDLDLELAVTREIFIDHPARKIRLISESDDKGVVGEEKQIFFRDHLGKVYSDQGVISYQFENGEFSLSSIQMEGNVRLMNRSGAALQLAIADEIAYSHECQQMHLKSNYKKRVLMYDKINNLQVSAPEIIMRRDAKTKKQQFQGIGDVRFHFAEKEYDQLRKRFLLEKKKL